MTIGHQLIWRYLKKSAETGNLAHAYLFTGVPSLGKRKMALELIELLIESEEPELHPDLLTVAPAQSEKDGITKEREINISDIRKIQHQMSMSPYQAPHKIALIDEAEKMTQEAASCLLKTLEEPSDNSILILISSNPGLVLPTVLSRCQQLKFLPVSRQEILKGLTDIYQREEQELAKIVRLSIGRPGLAIKYLNEPELLANQKQIIEDLQVVLGADINDRYKWAEKNSKDVSSLRNVLRLWGFWFRDLILKKTGCENSLIYNFETEKYSDDYSLERLKNILASIKKTDRILSNSSINARLALEVLMLEI